MNSIMNIVNNEQIDCEAERGLLEEIKKVRAMPRLEKIMHSKISPERKHVSAVVILDLLTGISS
jgi:hypothetical protein